MPCMFLTKCRETLLQDAHYANFNRKRVKLALDISWSALPIRLNTIILTFPAIKSEAKLFLPVILWLMSRGLRQRALVFSGCPNELCFDLEEIRLRKRCIPDVLGGQFCLEDFQQWIRKRREHEVASSSSLGPTRMLLEDMDDVSE